MARVPAATRESVPQSQQDAFDERVQSRGGVPRTPWLHHDQQPGGSRRASHLSEYLRRESTLPAKVQELAMLVTARELDCQHIWRCPCRFRQTAVSAWTCGSPARQKPLPPSSLTKRP
jgi:hypothetical protein